MKRVVLFILYLLTPFAGLSAEIKKETPIAYYSITDLTESEESLIYTAAVFREISDRIEEIVNENPPLFENQPVTYLIEICPSGFIRTLKREEGDPSYGITDSLNKVLSSRRWVFIPFWEKLEKEGRTMAKSRLRIYPKCIVISADKTAISKHTMSLEGNVRLSYGKYKIEAEKIEYDQDARAGLAGGPVLMKIVNGEYKTNKGISFSFANDGALSNYFWQELQRVH